MKQRILLLFVMIAIPLLLKAQSDTTQTPKKTTISFYTPQLNGLIKAKWEYCFDDNTNRFDIRNTRLGIGGSINPYVGYRLQVEYSSHGDLYLLDAYATFSASKRSTFYFGQVTVPFSEDYVISPSQNMFANRTFVAKFINLTSRDIGARIDYQLLKNTPLTLQAGVFNGSGINRPVWQDSPYLLGRLVYGTMQGFRTSVKYYGGEGRTGNVANYGMDFRYAHSRYKIEAEIVAKDSIDVSNRQLLATYLQGAYSFPIKNKELLKYIEPVLRGDAMGLNVRSGGFDISRLTMGINFGFDMKPMAAEVRFNYEKLFLRKFLRESAEQIQQHIYYQTYFNATDKGLYDKFTIEFLIKF